MALKITPGPLPDDGTRVKIQDFLQTFVQGTQIANFSPEEFEGDSDVSFIISQTDAPATNTRSRGTMWFARGQGVLYLWTLHPSPTEATTSATNGSWVAMSNRKEMLVQIAHDCTAGQIVRMNTDNSRASNFGGQIHRLAEDGRYWMLASSTSISGADPDWDAFHPAYMVDPCLVAMTDASHGSFIPATEWGFVDIKARGAGIDGNDYLMGFFTTGDEDYDTLKVTNHSSWTNTAARVAYMSESGTSNDIATLRKMFLAPTVSNLLHGREGVHPFV